MYGITIARTLMRYSTVGGGLVILFIINGCAVMNTSIMETAETANPGAIRVGGEMFVGPDLGNNSFFENSHQNAPLAMWGVGGSLGLGVTKNLECSGKLWVGSYGISSGTRVQVKYRLPSPIAAIQWAVLPGFNHVSLLSDANEKPEYAVSGADIPIVVSWGSESQVLYMAARYSIDTLTRDFGNESVTLKRVGVLAGISIRIWKLYIRPELGYEKVIGHNGISTGGVGLGLEDMQLF